MQIVNQRIRLAIDTSQMGSINDVLTGANPQFWNGVDLQIELGLFYGSSLVDVSNFDSITVELKEAEPRTGLPIMSQTIASGSLNTALILNAWNGGAPADCHALAVFTNGETNLQLSDDSVTFWLVVSALTNDSPGHKVVLGATPIVVQEGGEGVTPPASVVNPTYYTAAQSDARYTLAVDLTSINSHLSTLDSEVAAVITTANAALPKSGGTFSGALTVTGLSGVLKAAAGLVSGSATTTDLTEGTNLYWTQARFNTALGAVSGAASGVCPLDSGSLIPAAFLPALAITNTFVVASQAAMLALSSATVGDICVRTDLSQTFILSAAPPSTLGNWAQLLQPSSAVTSVNTLTGAVVLTTTNVAEGTNLYYTTARVNAAALATSLTGFSAGSGGTVTSGDTILSALGKFENRMALNDAKTSAAGYALLNGSLAFTGMINFSGGTNAGIQLSNLTDTQRAALTAQNGMLIYDSTLSSLMFYNGAWQTVGVGGNAAIWSGAGAPASSLGNNGDYYLNTSNGSWYLKSSGAWAVIYAGGATLTSGITFTPLLNPAINFGNSWTINAISASQMSWNFGSTQGLLFSEVSPSQVDVVVENGVLWAYQGIKDSSARQILNSRITGWGAASNGSRAAFNGSGATLAQTSAALAQLIIDCTTQGFIGA